MRSVSDNVRFVRSYLLASFGHVQNFERTPPDKDFRWMNVSCALVCGLSGSRASDIVKVSCMDPSMSVRPRLWNGQPLDMQRLKRTSTRAPHVKRIRNAYNGSMRNGGS